MRKFTSTVNMIALPLASLGMLALMQCSSTNDNVATSMQEGGAPPPIVGSDGPNLGPNPNVHEIGDKNNGQKVFRFETFGNEGFWTDALKLPKGVLDSKFTPVMALKAGLSVDIDALDAKTVAAIGPELKTDLSPQNAPLLNNVKTTIALLNANAVIGLAVKDSNGDGKLDLATGDKVGVTCSFCHTVTDGSVFQVPNGGGIGHRLDGQSPHTVNVGASIALGANSRAYYPLLQLQQPDGSTHGRAPTGLTKNSTEAEVDAYLTNPQYYPPGTFDDTFDGNGNPMHNPPMFRADLGAPWGTAGEFQFLDQFSNTVYSILLDPTTLTTDGGKALLHKIGGAGGDAIEKDYEAVLAATGVTGYPFVKGDAGPPGMPNSFGGIALDHQKLIDLSAYFNSLPAPAGNKSDPVAIGRGREVFRTQGCTNCHNVSQSVAVPFNIIDINKIWPGFAPVVLASRDAPFSPIEDSPGTFDDKMIVVNATLRGLNKGTALPMLLDLDRKPVFLHDSSVPNLENLLDASRGSSAPHPFYLSGQDRSDVVAFLKGLDTSD